MIGSAIGMKHAQRLPLIGSAVITSTTKVFWVVSGYIGYELSLKGGSLTRQDVLAYLSQISGSNLEQPIFD